VPALRWSSGVVDEARDGGDLDAPSVQVDDRDQGIDEGDLEEAVAAPHRQTILAWPLTHRLDHPDLIPRLVEDDQPDQLLGPELAVGERATLGDGDDRASDPFCGFPVGHPFEGDLEATIGAAQGLHQVRVISQIDE
jgi:hypothetical protein